MEFFSDFLACRYVGDCFLLEVQIPSGPEDTWNIFKSSEPQNPMYEYHSLSSEMIITF